MRRLLASLVALLALLVSIELSAQETEPVEALPAVEDVPDAAAPVGVVPEDLATERMAPLEAQALEAAPAPLEPSASTPVSVEARVPLDADSADITHTVFMTGRFIHLPGGILDSWFSKHAGTWQGQANVSAGLEYVLRFVDVLDLQFGVFWTDLSMPGGYWLESGKDDWAAADYTEVGLSTLTGEVSVFGYWDFIDDLGLFFGGGVWFGALLGDISKSNVLESCASEAQQNGGSLSACPHDPVAFAEQSLPPVIGFLTASIGLRAAFDEHVVVKLEGGFRGYFFGGLSVGAQFF
ncbi:MAG: hypothetical protein RBU37_15425 [Myxococcota bacterium]|nr:hypothetical protein [Myxococcota bacterium]